MPLTVELAEGLIREGRAFGDVAPLLDAAAIEQLRAWYTRAEGVPVNPVRPAPVEPEGVWIDYPPPGKPMSERAIAQTLGYAGPVAGVPTASGDLCPKCGGLMVRTGSCSTCQSCGESSGGCG